MRTQALRDAWAEYAKRADLMVGVDVLGARPQVNPRIVDAVRALGHALEAAGYRADRVGGFSDRAIKGSARLSLHAYGIAIDIDARDNPHRRGQSGPARWSSAATQDERRADVAAGRADTTFTPQQIAAVRAIHTTDGIPVFFWAGAWSMSPDAMHFQIDVTPTELARGIAVSPSSGAVRELHELEEHQLYQEEEEARGEEGEGRALFFGPSVFEESEEPEDIDQEEWLEAEEEDEVAAARELQISKAVARDPQRKPVQPEIILVVGANYPKFEKQGKEWRRVRSLSEGPWRQFSLSVARERLIADPALEVTLFDLLRGTRENVTLDTGTRAVTKVEQQFTPPTAQDYWNLSGIDLGHPPSTPGSAGRQLALAMLEPGDKPKFAQKPQINYWDGVTAASAGKPINLLAYANGATNATAPVISITDVYAYIEGFAAAGKSGALRELHFFAHAFSVRTNQISGGPILLNSLDSPFHPDRFVIDKDARASKDFRKPTMDPAVFAKAFDREARSFVWGCNFQRGFVRQFVYQIGLNGKILAAGKPMKISHNSDWGDKDAFRTHLDLPGTAPVKNVKVDQAKVEQILHDADERTYMRALARASGRPVVGAPAGTYSAFDGDRSPLALLHVPMTGDPFRRHTVKSKESRVTFERALLYIRDTLKRSFDKSFGDHNGLGRGYVIYDP